MLRYKIAILVGVLLWVGAIGTQVKGQIVNGAIVGTAFDPTGAVVPSARVTVTEIETHLVRIVVTDSVGDYALRALPPGTYRLTAVHSGFQTEQIGGIVVNVGQTVAVNVHFRVGETSATITVNANAARVQSETSSVGQLINEQQVENLPLNGRNYVTLAYLGSGSTPQYQSTSSPVGPNTDRSDFTAFISGNGGDADSWLIDGVETRGYFLGQPSIDLSLDAIQEFRVQKNMFEARYGDGSGIVSVATKSGSDTFHGSTYEYLRNDSLDAANFFNNLFGTPKTAYKWNQFGGSAGGPIRKNKMFFFTNYEGFRYRQQQLLSGDVPTAAELAGDESALVGGSSKTNPVTGAPAIINPFTGQAFPGGQIPATMLSSVVQKMNPYIPKPNTQLPGINLVVTPNLVRDDNQGTGRYDWTINDHDDFFARYIDYRSDLSSPGAAAYEGSVLPLHGENVALEETHTFSPTLLNTFRFGFNRDVFYNGYDVTPTNVVQSVGIKNITNLSQYYGLPSFGIAGYTGFGGTNVFQGNIGNTFQYTDEVDWMHGRHGISFGADIRREQIYFLYALDNNGAFDFNGQYSGSAIADLVLGAANSEEGQEGLQIGNFRSTEYSFFFQDDFKVTHKLTLDLGLRYEYREPPYEINGEEGYFDPQLDALVERVTPGFYPTIPSLEGKVVFDPLIQPGIWKPDRRDWQPRLGFAYSLGNNTVLRGGAGIFYSESQGQEIQGKMNMPPLTATLDLTGNLTGSPNVLVDQSFPPLSSAPAGTLSPFSVDPSDRLPYDEQWNFGIQHTFGSSILFESEYVGSAGHHLNDRIDLNEAFLPGPSDLPVAERRPYPGWGPILSFNWAENSNYNSWQSSLEKHMSHGLTLLTSYTWAHVLDTSDRGAGGTFHEDNYDREADYGNANFDVRNDFNAGFTYELPFGSGKPFLGGARGVNEKLVGGWSVNGIALFMTGNYYSVLDGSDVANVGGYADERASEVAGCADNGNLSHGQRTIYKYFNTSCFYENPFGTFGNTGRDIIEIPGLNNWDLSVMKNIHISERLTSQFRAEFFNAWNHAQFGPPNTVPVAPTFGEITSTGHDPREIQLALRLQW